MIISKSLNSKKKASKKKTVKGNKKQDVAKTTNLLLTRENAEEINELENQYKISCENVCKAVDGFLGLISNSPRFKNRLFDEPLPLFLQVNIFKIFTPYSRIVRFPLKHSVLQSDREVCLIVPDRKGVPNKDHDKHLEYYEDLLERKQVKDIKKIMTFHEFRTEYETFELKSRLVDLYDVFLVDGRISGKVVRKCGKIFYKKRKVPTAVKLQVSKLKEHIDQTLAKSPMYFHGKGDSFVVQFGHSKMDASKLIANIFAIIKRLDKNMTGGFSNIRNINLYAHKAVTLPIYVSLNNPNNVTIDENESKASKEPEPVTGELSTRINCNVTVTPRGEVTSSRIRKFSKKYKRINKNLSKNTANTGGGNETSVASKKRKNTNKTSEKYNLKKKPKKQ